MTRWAVEIGLIVLFCGGLLGQSNQPPLTLEVAGVRLPQFVEKPAEISDSVIVEVVFRNSTSAPQTARIGKDMFKAMTADDEPIEIRALVFMPPSTEGAASMKYVGTDPPATERLTESLSGKTVFYMLSPGPLEVVVPQGGKYTQRLLLKRPPNDKPFRIKFDKYPELQIRR